MNSVRTPGSAVPLPEDSLFDLSPLLASLAAASLNPRMPAIFFAGPPGVAHIFVERIAAARKAACRILEWQALASPALTTSFFSLLAPNDVVHFVDHDLCDAMLCARWRRMAHDQVLGVPAGGADMLRPVALNVAPFTSVFCGSQAALDASPLKDAFSLVIDISRVRDVPHARAIASGTHLACLLGEAARAPHAPAGMEGAGVDTQAGIRAVTARLNELARDVGAGAAGASQDELDACRERLLKLIADNASREYADTVDDAHPQLDGLIQYWREP